MADFLFDESLETPLETYIKGRLVSANEGVDKAENELVKGSLIPRDGYMEEEFKSYVVQNSRVLVKMPRYKRAKEYLEQSLEKFLTPKGIFLLLICHAIGAFAADYSSEDVPDELIDAIATYYQLMRLKKAKWLSLINGTAWVSSSDGVDVYLQGANLKSREILGYAKKKRPDISIEALGNQIRERSAKRIIEFERKLESNLLDEFDVEDVIKLYLGYYSNTRGEYQKKLEEMENRYQQEDIETLQRMGDEALNRAADYSRDEKEQLIKGIEKIKTGFSAVLKKADIGTIGGIVKRIIVDENRAISKEWYLYACRFHRLALYQARRLLESHTEKVEDEKFDRKDFLDKNKFKVKEQKELVELGLERYYESIIGLDKLVTLGGKGETDEAFKELEDFKRTYNELVGRKKSQDSSRKLRGFLLTNARFKGLTINYNLYDLYEEYFMIKMPPHDFFKADQTTLY